MLSVTQTTEDLVIVDAAGTLTREDYAQFEAEIDEVAGADEALRVLIRLSDFHGWEPSALWEDVKFDVRHHNTFERIAVVGHSDWQEWMTRLSKPFTAAEVRYFDANEAPGAVGWLLGASS